MYTIKIEKTTLELQPATQSYEKVKDYEGAEGPNGESKYGYVTRPPQEKEVTKIVYQQVVDSADIVAVVAAINGANFTGYGKKE